MRSPASDKSSKNNKYQSNHLSLSSCLRSYADRSFSWTGCTVEFDNYEGVADTHEHYRQEEHYNVDEEIVVFFH